MFRASRLTTLMTSLLLLLAMTPVAARAVTVWVEPADTTVVRGTRFTLRLMCDAVPDLKGCQAIERFDASVLGLVSVQPGDVFTAGGAFAWFPLPDVTAPVDSAWVDAAMLDGSARGPGVLAYLEFDAAAVGVSPVECAWADIRDSANAQVLPDRVPAVVHVETPVAATSGSWGRLKTRYR
jgi:hypothetical protein